MRIVVAGGTGFLGKNVVQALAARHHSLLLLARRPCQPPGSNQVHCITCDLSSGDLPVRKLEGAEAIVNLVGIKGETRDQTFEKAHVQAVKHLLHAGKALGIRHFIHISVVSARPDSKSPYHDTKWRSEEIIRDAGLGFTILKPGVIYGPGDDLVSQLIKAIKISPIFPLVGRGRSLLQPVDARDVALAVAESLARSVALGKSYDLVGPERMEFRQVVATVAKAFSRKVLLVPMPIALQRLAVKVMNAIFRNPLLTPAQLQMIVDGLYGDPEPARRDLGLEPRPFTPESVREAFSTAILQERAH